MRCISTVFIDKPIQEVWSFFDNSDNMPQWLTGFVEFKPLSGEPGTIGARALHVYDLNGRMFELEETITDKVPFERFAGILSNPSMESHMETLFTDMGDGRTKLLSISDVKFKSWMFRLMGRFMKKGFQSRQDADLNRLKQAIEGQDGS